MPSPLLEETLGSIVAADYRAAAVLSRFGLDFCCGGKRTLAEACRGKACEPETVAAAIHDMLRSPARKEQPDTDWDPIALVEHIVDTHHRYIRESTPRIAGYLRKVVEVHGARHPELARVAGHFDELARELASHMYKEEEILFPYIRQLAAVEGGGDPPPNVFGTVGNPIRVMETEHAGVGRELALLRGLSDGYRTPADGCATYRVCFQELEAFEADLQRHIHLENNVLFPKTLALERIAATAGGIG